MDETRLRLEDDSGAPVLLQPRVLDRWSDGSLRWVLVRWLATVDEETVYRLRIAKARETSPSFEPQLHVETWTDRVIVRTGKAQFDLRAGAQFPFEATTATGRPAGKAVKGALDVTDAEGRTFAARVATLELEETGSLYARVRLGCDLVGSEGVHPLRLFARLHFFGDRATVGFDVTLHNPRRALHSGGFWELGDPGSFLLRSASVKFVLTGAVAPELSCSPELEEAYTRFALPFELYQDSSGGENWKSRVHANRFGSIPLQFRGYRLRSGDEERYGLRAEPLVGIDDGEQRLALAMPHCWANFPKAVESDGRTLALHLFPPQSADLHELQGGERKTHSFFVAFGPDEITKPPLAWCRSPTRVRTDPVWYCSSCAVPYLVPRLHDSEDEREQLIEAAIEGPESFFAKRERIDEYGWRNFGDLYADHEAAFHEAPEPLVSHYNNQYDAIAGFAQQFLRSGDFRWWDLMNQLAAHVADIDVYHTDEDKAAYNHGLFWHTDHYVDAGTSTHRGYPHAPGVIGGGPSNEHNYTTGLMLHHFLTGSALSRETVLELASWVIDMDDGRKSPFRWLARGPTGLASRTAEPSYHGPGRGAGNSINALIDAFGLTRERRFLEKAEELVRRCIHPEDDITSMNLGNPELRWSYVVFLQKLTRYLDLKTELGERDAMYDYARAALLHYARWMAENEYPYLEKPELLEYPTETWAAQDIRKSDVFYYAALHAPAEERERFLRRARFFFQNSVSSLLSMETRTRTRPVVILLTNGVMHSHFERHPDGVASPAVDPAVQFPPRRRFVPQKQVALRRATLLFLLLILALLAVFGLIL